MQVQFLGSGDAFGSGGRLQACIRLTGDGDDVLLDYGATSLVAMKRDGLDPANVGYVLVSHLHGDHYGGLPFLVLHGQFNGRTRDLHVAGPPGTEERLRAAMEVLFPGSSSVRRKFAVQVIELEVGGQHLFGPARVTPLAVDHASGAPSFGYRVEYGGATVGYSGDTAWTDTLLELAHDTDLFICEAYFAEKRVPFHVDAATIRSRRDDLKCRRLIVTHMTEDLLAQVEPLGLEAAYDGLIVEL